MRCRVVAIDVGSVKGNFAWAGIDLPTRGKDTSHEGEDPASAARAVLDALVGEDPVALGFEAPLTVPVSPIDGEGWKNLGKARNGDTGDGFSRPWSAGAGAAVLATGLAQVAWVLRRIADEMPDLSVTTQPQAWLDGTASLLLWEAFVSSEDKPVPGHAGSQHAADALAATKTFSERLASSSLDVSDVTCPDGSFNLAAAAAQYAGLEIGSGEIGLPVSVYRSKR